MAGRIVALNDQGLPIGETHHNARLTDAEVELIRSLHEEGMSYSALVAKFDVSKSTVADICKYRRRAQTPAKWKTISTE